MIRIEYIKKFPMKNFIILIGFSFMFCGNNNANIEWMKNGNLHNATVVEWKNADESNKLATCADIAAKLKSTNNEKYS